LYSYHLAPVFSDFIVSVFLSLKSILTLQIKCQPVSHYYLMFYKMTPITYVNNMTFLVYLSGNNFLQAEKL